MTPIPLISSSFSRGLGKEVKIVSKKIAKNEILNPIKTQFSEYKKEKRKRKIEGIKKILKSGIEKKASGDMLQYFSDHPEKLREKLERDRKKKKMYKIAMEIDIKEGDIVLGGKFKNHRIEVKSIGEDEIGQPIINGDRKLLAVRIEKKLPEGMWSSASLAEKYKEKNMDKQAVLNEVYNSALEDELEKIALSGKTYLGVIKKLQPQSVFINAQDLVYNPIGGKARARDLADMLLKFRRSNKILDKKIVDLLAN